MPMPMPVVEVVDWTSISPYFVLKCIKSGYDTTLDVNDYSQVHYFVGNDCRVPLMDGLNPHLRTYLQKAQYNIPWTLNEYLYVLNESIQFVSSSNAQVVNSSTLRYQNGIQKRCYLSFQNSAFDHDCLNTLNYLNAQWQLSQTFPIDCYEWQYRNASSFFLSSFYLANIPASGTFLFKDPTTNSGNENVNVYSVIMTLTELTRLYTTLNSNNLNPNPIRSICTLAPKSGYANNMNAAPWIVPSHSIASVKTAVPKAQLQNARDVAQTAFNVAQAAYNAALLTGTGAGAGALQQKQLQLANAQAALNAAKNKVTNYSPLTYLTHFSHTDPDPPTNDIAEQMLFLKFYLQLSFQLFSDGRDRPCAHTTVETGYTIARQYRFDIHFHIQKTLTTEDYAWILYDPLNTTPQTSNTPIYTYTSSMHPPYSSSYSLNANANALNKTWANNLQNTWSQYLHMGQPFYTLSSYMGKSKTDSRLFQKLSYAWIYSDTYFSGYRFTLTHDTSLRLKGPQEDMEFDIPIKAPTSATHYTLTRQELYAQINTFFASSSVFYHSMIGDYDDSFNTRHTLLRLNINNQYRTSDFTLVFYDDQNNNTTCQNQNNHKMWDCTLGWLLGFHNNKQYPLSTVPSPNSVRTLVGDSIVVTNLYNYFMISLDDFSQSTMNDGLVTIGRRESKLKSTVKSSLSKGSLTQHCLNGSTFFTGQQQTNKYSNGITQKQIYAANQLWFSGNNTVVLNTSSSGPFKQDLFGMIPMKVAGLPYGSSYVEFGGTLQNQERLYLGPVNISRLTIQLITDKGVTLDLNGANWSFSFVCEQLYQQNSI